MLIYKVDSAQFQADLKRRIQKAEHTENLMRPIANDLQDSTEANFKAQGREPRWQKLKDKTIKAKIRDRGSTRILQGRGDLIASIQNKYTRYEAIVGSYLSPDKGYARIHQYGGMAGRNHSARIPARPFLKLTNRELREIKERVERYFA